MKVRETRVMTGSSILGRAGVGAGAMCAFLVLALAPKAAHAQAAATAGGGATVNAGAGGTVTSTTTTTTTVGTPATTTTPPATVAHEEGSTVPRSEEEKEVESEFTLGFDMVLGFGKSETVTQNAFGPNNFTYSTGNAQTTTESFLFSAGWEATHHLAFGVRVPFTHGTLFPPGTPDSRDLFAVGNVEVGGEYRFDLSEQLALFAELGVAIPTAQGTERPDNLTTVNGTTFDQTSYDRHAIQSAAAAARGWEDNALYETDHLGIIPKLKLEYHAGRFELEPYIKYESLIGTRDNLEKQYIGELVFGGRIGARVADCLSVGVRVWSNVPLDNAPGIETVGVAEPEVRLHLGPVEPYAGVILPFAGPLDNPYTVGARFGIIGRL
jgi:hypothetical protein